MSKIWYIHPYSGNPKKGMSFRPYFLSKNFNKLGYDTTVISSQYHHLSNLSESSVGYKKVEDIDYYFVPTNVYSGNGISRVRNMLTFGFNLFGKKFRLFAKKNKPEVIVASSAHPFHIFAAKYYANKYRAKLILEVRDLWPLSLEQLVGLSRFHPLSILINIAQKFAYKNCDECVSLLPNAKEYMVNRGLEERKFNVIPNGIEFDDQNEPQDARTDISLLADTLKAYKLVIGYTGAHGIPNNLMPLIQGIKECGSTDVACVLVGEGSERRKLIEYAKVNNLNNIYFLDQMPKHAIPQVIEQCDYMFINAIPKEIYKYGISPNKVFDYLSCNKPIINGIDSPGNPIEMANAEIKFTGDSVSSLVEVINGLLEQDDVPKFDTEDFVKLNYSYSTLAARYISIFKR